MQQTHQEKMDAHNKEVRERNAKFAQDQATANQRHHDEQVRRIHGQPEGCFAAGTSVMTAAGLRRIDALDQGDDVYAFCDATNQIVERKIEKHVVHSAARIWEILILDADQPIGTTGCHLFLTRRGWKRTRQLRPGDFLHTGDGWAKIQSVQVTTRIEPVYNLIVDGDLTFIADGVVAHSFAYFRVLRTWLHRRKRSFRNLQEARVNPSLA